ncbi:MAG: MgtC/SapB family protein [Thermomicrobiales bacterium]
MFDLDEQEMIIRLFAALAAGAIIGFEREVRNRPAGLRTHALASEGAALFTMAAILISIEAQKSGFAPSDPGRIISTIVQGIGFLAAGVIFAHHQKVHGLTTAAGLWVTAAVGVLCGAGLYFLALAATFATTVVLALVKVLEDRMSPGKQFE